MASAGTAYVDVEAKLDEFASQIEAEVSSIDAQQIDVEAVADTGQVQAELDSIEGGTVTTDVEVNTDQAQGEVADLTGTVDGLTGSMSEGAGAAGDFGDALGVNLGGGLNAASVGLGGVLAALGASAMAAGEAQVAVAQFDHLLANAGDSAQISSEHVQELATSIMEYSGFSDEAVLSGAAMLVTFENIANNPLTFDRTLTAAADLAVFMGTDVPSAAKMLGRALNDPEQGINRLARVFPSLTAAQKEAISAMAESGDIAGAQAAIFDIVEGKVGGLAETYGETLPGQIDIAKEKFGELAETIGGQTLPVMAQAVDGISSMSDALQDLDVTDPSSGPGAMRSWLEGLALINPVGTANVGFNQLREQLNAPEWTQGGAALFLNRFTGDGDALTKQALGTLPKDLNDTADAANDAAQAFDTLDQAVSAYFEDTFSVPQAQRDLRDSFHDLFQTLLTEGHSADDVAASLENVATRTGNLGAANGDFAGTADLSIQRLRGMRDAGQLTAAEFDNIRDAIRGAQAEAPLNVVTTTPGLPAAIAGAHNFREEINSIDRYVRVTFDVATAGIDAANDAIANVAANARRLGAQDSTAVGVNVRSGPTGGGGGNVVNANIAINASPGTDSQELARLVTDELRKLERAGR